MDLSEKMFELVRLWRESGLSQREFCKQHQIGVAKLGYWVGKEKQSVNGVGFLELSARHSTPSVGYEVVYPNSVRVSYQGNDLTILSQLIRLY